MVAETQASLRQQGVVLCWRTKSTDGGQSVGSVCAAFHFQQQSSVFSTAAVFQTDL